MRSIRKLKVEYENGEFLCQIDEKIHSPKQLHKIFLKSKDWVKEHLIGIYLDDDLNIQSYEILTVGGSDTSLVFPEDVFRSVMLTNSKYFILLHNHPSGNNKPSPEDREVCKLIIQQSRIMKKHFLDCLIISEKGYWSLFDEMGGGDYSLGSIF